jgi:hypothetical protein
MFWLCALYLGLPLPSGTLTPQLYSLTEWAMESLGKWSEYIFCFAPQVAIGEDAYTARFEETLGW